jgi:hypothetical protein
MMRMSPRYLMLFLVTSSATARRIGIGERGGQASPSPLRTAGTGACDPRVPTARYVGWAVAAPVQSLGVVPGDAQTCEFASAGFKDRVRLFVSVRPGMGHLTIQSWLDGKMPLRAQPVAGIGTRAVWLAELDELLAERDNLLCDIAVIRSDEAKSKQDAALAARLGVLCNKIFASAR